MKVFVLLRSYTDYKGSSATSCGVFNYEFDAKKALEKIVYDMEVEYEMNDSELYYTDESHKHWCQDDGDSVLEYYIQEDEIKDCYPTVILCKDDIENEGFDLTDVSEETIDSIFEEVYDYMNESDWVHDSWSHYLIEACKRANLKHKEEV